MQKPHSDPRNTQVTPEPALEKRTRRKFKPEYKLRIIPLCQRCCRCAKKAKWQDAMKPCCTSDEGRSLGVAD